MNFALRPEDQALVEVARRLKGEFAARAREYDEAAAFPTANFAQLREGGLLKMTVPVEFGGHGFWRDDRFAAYYTVLETIAAGCSSTAQLLQVHSHASGIVGYLGNDEQRRRILGAVVSRGALIASCGSEVDPGSLTQGAERKSELTATDGGFRLTTVKHFASLAPAADYMVVYVMAPGATTMATGYTTVIVERDAPGVSFTNEWDTMGMRPTVSWALRLDDVFVPMANVLGEPGDWIQHDPRTFTLAYAANHLGTSQGVYDFLVDYLKGRPHLMRDDVVAYTLGEMSAALQSTRTSMWYAAWLWEQGKFDAAEQAGMRALHTSKQTAMYVTTKAFDVCGSRSAFRSLPLERALRDVRTFSLHFRESQNLRMLANAEIALDPPFHSKAKYGPKLGRQRWT